MVPESLPFPRAWAHLSEKPQSDGHQAHVHSTGRVGESVLSLFFYFNGVFPGPQALIYGIEVGDLLEFLRPESPCSFQSFELLISKEVSWL